MKKILFYKIVVVSVLTIFLISSIGQAFFMNNSNTNFENDNETKFLLTSSSFQWRDDFLDEGRIDILKSYNYILDKTLGLVKMKDTYEAWYNPSWTRMKIIDVYNSGSETFEDYVLDLNVYYDSDMQNDFDDLRFTDSEGNDLYYWIGERVNGEHANVLVRIPMIIPGHTDVHMFYSDPNAEDESNFDMIFTWDDRTSPDIMISYKNYLEGAWDPDVEWGGGRFLVAWEERLGPEDLLGGMERTIYSVIHGRTYNEDGGDPFPTGDADINIAVATGFHAENPCIAYGNGKFLVVWEENPTTFLERFEADIKGAFVSPGGSVLDMFTICNAPLLQCDPSVAYDDQSGKFFVVWEDARAGTSNYDVYGRLVSSSGPIGSDFQVAAGSNCQDEPWICSDNQGIFMVVYEDGFNPETGPFGLKAQRYDPNGNQVGSTLTIATGSDSIDNIFPSVTYCNEKDRYFISWNDADLSSGQWRGNIWGKILDKYGNTIYDNFIVQPGSIYVRTDVVPYLDTLFFVSYDGISDLWGKLISSDGVVQTDEHMLSDGSSLNVDWNNLAVGNGKIMAVWEDERDQASDYADAFGSVWHIYKTTGSPHVSYNIGDEKQIITSAVITSKVISPPSLQEWGEFDAVHSTPIGIIRFDILNEDATQVLMSNINPGMDISTLAVDKIRLKATFERTIPNDTPILDEWSVSYIGADYEPPWTEYTLTPSTPNGENGWYTVSVELSLYPHDDISPPEEIITYYRINGGTQKIYNAVNKPQISSERRNNEVEFWSMDAAGNNETPHNIITDIMIDRTKPTVTITTPSWGIVKPGDVKVSGTIYESLEGSSINKVEIYFNGGKIPDSEVQLSANKDYFEWHFRAEGSGRSLSNILNDILDAIQALPAPLGFQYDIEVRAYDYAGNMGNAYVTVTTSKTRDMNPFLQNILHRLIENFLMLERIIILNI
jgi:hypothetical protein